MAYIISTEDHLTKDYKTQKKLFWWMLSLSILTFALWLLFIFLLQEPNLWFLILCPAAGLGLLAIAKSRYSQMSILAAGIRGEKAALNILKELDSEHWVVTDKKITHKGKSAELDFVVIGPTGVCIIECKHLAGTIDADPKAKYWLQTKVSQGGVERTKKFYSPVKQVGTHLYRLKQFLKEKGVSVHLDSAVFFPNPETQLRFQEKFEETPVFWGEKGPELLLKFLRKERTPLTPAQVLEIAEFLHADK